MLEVLVDRDHVRVGERARQPRLAQEALGVRRVVAAERAQLLERDQPLQVGLAREMHDRHAALAQDAQHLVAADRQRHFVVAGMFTNDSRGGSGRGSGSRGWIRLAAPSSGASPRPEPRLSPRWPWNVPAISTRQRHWPNTAPPSDFSAFRALAASAADAFEVPRGLPRAGRSSATAIRCSTRTARSSRTATTTISSPTSRSTAPTRACCSSTTSTRRRSSSTA